MEEEGPKKIYLNVEGPLTVTAGHIEETSNITIMNLNMKYVLEEGNKLSIEFTVEMERDMFLHVNYIEDKLIGLIPIDAILVLFYKFHMM